MAEILLWQQKRNTVREQRRTVIHLYAGKEYAKQIVGGNVPFSDLHKVTEVEAAPPAKLKPSEFAELIDKAIREYKRSTYKFKILLNMNESRENDTYVNLTIRENFLTIEKGEYNECKEEYKEALEEYCESNNIYSLYLLD